MAPLRILLVEDHEDSLRVMTRLLRGLRHDVQTATCIQGALASAARQPFDLLISDLGLPDGSGLDLMRQLLAAHPIRGIALTGYGNEVDVDETRAAGFSTHLVKPIDFADLQAAIERI